MGWGKGVGVVRNGCGQSDHRTLKLTVSQEWVDGRNWFFACWCKFRKAKSNLNDFWVNVIRIGHGHLVHETLKSAEWEYELSWFFACWLQCNNFGKTNIVFYIFVLNIQITAVLLVKTMAVAGMILWNMICPSLPPHICLGVFLKLDH